MASIKDLFVSFKSLDMFNRNNTSQVVTPEVPTTFADYVDNVRKRVSSISTDPPESDYDTEGEVENQNDFSWYMRDPLIQSNPEEPESPDEQKPKKKQSATASVKYNRGKLDKEIKALFDKHGIKIKVTSGKRKAGAVGKAGNRSYHIHGNACDIVPVNGDYDALRKAMTENEDIRRFFWENGLGVIDETIPANMRKTGATGPHFHIGPDRWAVRTWTAWTGNWRPQPDVSIARFGGKFARLRQLSSMYNGDNI